MNMTAQEMREVSKHGDVSHHVSTILSEALESARRGNYELQVTSGCFVWHDMTAGENPTQLQSDVLRELSKLGYRWTVKEFANGQPYVLLSWEE